MADEELGPHLRRLGLPQDDAELYTWLLEFGPANRSQVAAELTDADKRIDGLARAGLVALTQADTVVPIDPGTAVRRLVRAREAELHGAELAAANAYREFRRTGWHQEAGDIVEVVSNPHIAERVRFEEASATQEVLQFVAPPYINGARRNQTEIDNLARGVTYKCVYSRSAVQHAEFYAANIQPSIAAGEQARVVPEVPVKLAIYDGRVALVTLSDGATEVGSSLLIRQSSLLEALRGLFETSWRSALPMHLGSREPSSLRPIERKIIELMASGITDNAIAELLGVSRRTLSRNLETLTTRAGVVNRFQLAVYACRNGWL